MLRALELSRVEEAVDTPEATEAAAGAAASAAVDAEGGVSFSTPSAPEAEDRAEAQSDGEEEVAREPPLADAPLPYRRIDAGRFRELLQAAPWAAPWAAGAARPAGATAGTAVHVLNASEAAMPLRVPVGRSWEAEPEEEVVEEVEF